MPDVFNHLDNQSSDSNKRNSSSNLSIFAIDQNRLISDDFGLFNDDGSEHKLTLLGKSRMMIRLERA